LQSHFSLLFAITFPHFLSFDFPLQSHFAMLFASPSSISFHLIFHCIGL